MLTHDFLLPPPQPMLFIDPTPLDDVQWGMGVSETSILVATFARHRIAALTKETDDGSE